MSHCFTVSLQCTVSQYNSLNISHSQYLIFKLLPCLTISIFLKCTLSVFQSLKTSMYHCITSPELSTMVATVLAPPCVLRCARTLAVSILVFPVVESVKLIMTFVGILLIFSFKTVLEFSESSYVSGSQWQSESLVAV